MQSAIELLRRGVRNPTRHPVTASSPDARSARCRGRSQDTDRATCDRRLTALVRVHLAEFIRTGEWVSEQADLIRVPTSLRRRTYEHFLDPVVNAAWEDPVAKSVAGRTPPDGKDRGGGDPGGQPDPRRVGRSVQAIIRTVRGRAGSVRPSPARCHVGWTVTEVAPCRTRAQEVCDSSSNAPVLRFFRTLSQSKQRPFMAT